MNKLIYINLLAVVLLFGCMQPVDLEVDVLPDKSDIISLDVGLMGENGLFQSLPVTFEEIDAETRTITVHLKTFMSMESIWVSGRLENGCTIKPVGEAPAFGKYGDYTQPRKYIVTSPAGTEAEWTIEIMNDPNLPDISCIADLWTGAGVACKDEPSPGYSPTSVTAEKIEGSCNQIKFTINFWQDSNAIIELDVELGEFDENTFVGSVTLLNSVSFTSFGYNMAYEAGTAGTYSLNSLELNFDAAFSGYGSSGSYPLTFYKQ
ncbi:hypothetical protein EYV94_07760 [Puteibacter caeruleilacunae]|nr:hypothetical protein EYV94_07760 [Puteibacter caeruleilacunae]